MPVHAYARARSCFEVSPRPDHSSYLRRILFSSSLLHFGRLSAISSGISSSLLPQVFLTFYRLVRGTVDKHKSLNIPQFVLKFVFCARPIYYLGDFPFSFSRTRRVVYNSEPGSLSSSSPPSSLRHAPSVLIAGRLQLIVSSSTRIESPYFGPDYYVPPVNAPKKHTWYPTIALPGLVPKKVG